MTPEQFFTRADGSYRFARWARPIVPIVFGVDDATLAVVKGAIEAVVALAGHTMAETDPEQGANLFMFFFRDWDEVLAVPDLDRLVGGLTPAIDRLKARDANQYRAFRFDADGSIRAGSTRVARSLNTRTSAPSRTPRAEASSGLTEICAGGGSYSPNIELICRLDAGVISVSGNGESTGRCVGTGSDPAPSASRARPPSGLVVPGSPTGPNWTVPWGRVGTARSGSGGGGTCTGW